MPSFGAVLIGCQFGNTPRAPQFPPNTEQRTQFPRLAPFHNNLWQKNRRFGSRIFCTRSFGEGSAARR